MQKRITPFFRIRKVFHLQLGKLSHAQRIIFFFFFSLVILTIPLIKRAADKLKKMFSFWEAGHQLVCHSASFSLNYRVFLIGWALYLAHHRPLL